MKIGSACTKPGETDHGYLQVTELPTGQAEQVPIVIVDGDEPGPTLWVTAGIHPDETTGIATAHEFLDWVTPSKLAGTVVSVPVMNPSGLRLDQRNSYYHDEDANRQFGYDDSDESAPPRVQGVINSRIYTEMRESADAIVSLHTSWAASHPYVIHPRLTHGSADDESAVTELADQIGSMADAFGLPVVNSLSAQESAARSMHRTLSAVANNRDGIPTITPELGGRFIVDEAVRDAGVAGRTHVLHTLGMVDDPLPIEHSYSLPMETPLRRDPHPRTDTAGLVRYHVDTGDRVEAGQAVADVVSPHGAVQATIETEHDGFVISLMEGAAVYENDPILELAVPDDEPRIIELK